jgi:hypothetical protein
MRARIGIASPHNLYGWPRPSQCSSRYLTASAAASGNSSIVTMSAPRSHRVSTMRLPSLAMPRSAVSTRRARARVESPRPASRMVNPIASRGLVKSMDLAIRFSSRSSAAKISVIRADDDEQPASLRSIA